MSDKRIIAVFTGNRAEYGLQYPVLKAIDAHDNLDYRLIVSGAHLDDDFGKTIKEIQNDGFIIHSQVDIDLNEERKDCTSRAIGTGIVSMCEALNEIEPDILVVYADRFEGFAAVIASTQMNIPTAHIEGGDITEGGALDDSVRHAMTKLSHIHFTTNQQASNRILAMGEADWRVHTVGFPAIDMISEDNFATSKEIEEKYNIDTKKPIVLFTQHSVTTEFELSEEQIIPSLNALNELARKNIQIFITFPNNDAGGKKIIETINNFTSSLHENIQVHISLGRYFYHGILALSKDFDKRICCAGNSSSGIKETPAFKCPTVNIGSRQQGRLRSDNVLDADYDSDQIKTAINKCLFDDKFRNISHNCSNPYGEGDAGIKIAEVLSKVSLDSKTILRKEMLNQGKEKDGWYK